MRRTTVLLAFAVSLLCLRADAQDGPYRFVKEIAIGGEGGWDYLSVDPAAHRLFVSHGNRIVVIDTQQDKVAGEITDTPGVHGLTLASDLGRGLVANGGDNTVSIVDLATLKTIKKVSTGADSRPNGKAQGDSRNLPLAGVRDGLTVEIEPSQGSQCPAGGREAASVINGGV